MILDEIIKEAGEEKCEDRVLAWASIKKLQCKEEFGRMIQKGFSSSLPIGHLHHLPAT